MEEKSLETQTEPVPLQDPTSAMDLYTDTKESELLQCLKYLPEMDDYYYSTEQMLNLPYMDDNPLSYILTVKRYTRWGPQVKRPLWDGTF